MKILQTMIYGKFEPEFGMYSACRLESKYLQNDHVNSLDAVFGPVYKLIKTVKLPMPETV